MKIKLLKEAKVLHKEGEVVETSPEFAAIVVGNGLAEYVTEEPKPKKEKKSK